MILKASAILRNVEKSRSLFGVVTRTVSVMKTLDVLSSFWTSTQGMISFTAIREKSKSGLETLLTFFRFQNELPTTEEERDPFLQTKIKQKLKCLSLHSFSPTPKDCLFQNLSLKISPIFIRSAGLGSSAFAQHLPQAVLLTPLQVISAACFITTRRNSSFQEYKDNKERLCNLPERKL